MPHSIWGKTHTASNKTDCFWRSIGGSICESRQCGSKCSMSLVRRIGFFCTFVWSRSPITLVLLIIRLSSTYFLHQEYYVLEWNLRKFCETATVQCQSESLLSSPVTRHYLCFPQLQAHIGRARPHSTTDYYSLHFIPKRNVIFTNFCLSVSTTLWTHSFCFLWKFLPCSWRHTGHMIEKIIFQKFAPRWQSDRHIKAKSFAFYSNLREFNIEITTYFGSHNLNRLKHAITFFVVNVL